MSVNDGYGIALYCDNCETPIYVDEEYYSLEYGDYCEECMDVWMDQCKKKAVHSMAELEGEVV